MVNFELKSLEFMLLILNTATGEFLEAFIDKLSDCEELKGLKGFEFDWQKQCDYEVYKIALVEQPDHTLGLISCIDIPQELRVHVNLIEVNSSDIGRLKKLDRIAGCLIAYACSLAFKGGYGGFVSLMPKTKLIDLYQEKYGFRQFGRMLAVQYEASAELIKNYIGDEEI